MPTRAGWTLLTICGAFLLSPVTAADDGAPPFVAGDRWTYRYTQDGSERGTYTEQVGAIAEDGTAEFVAEGGSITTFDQRRHRYLARYAADALTGRPGAVLEDWRGNDSTLSFPLRVGAQWSVTQRYNNADTGYELSTVRLEAKVVGHERARTPAGEFDTYRIELVGRWRSEPHISEGLAGRQVETDWFAPSVKRLVRREIRSYGFTSAKTTSAVIYERVDELMSFRLAQTSP